MRFCTVTLGCKANQYDTGTIEEALLRRGHECIKPGSGCDVCIVNTCAVTSESVRKSRQAIRRVRKLEPAALIAVCGCYTQLDYAAAEALGADLAGGTDDRERFSEEIEKLYMQKTNGKFAIKNENNFQFSVFNFEFTRTRALLKIQDGCDNSCAYCIIPRARGISRSVSLPEIAQKARRLELQAYKEIVITGIEISSYRPNLLDALRETGTNAPGARLRLGSLNPDILTADFIRKLQSIRRLCNHFHISLQSGSDATLTRMGRTYTTCQVEESIARLRGAFENCSITADLIVGFPGETECEFEQTLNFIRKAAFSAMHIFPFSPRPGTKAVQMPDQIAGSVKQQRVKTAAAAAAKLSLAYKEEQIGKTLEVLFETYNGKNSIGHSDNYLSVAVRGEITKNTLINVSISGINNGLLFGESNCCNGT